MTEVAGADEVDGDVVLICWPVVVEVVEERWPVVGQTVGFEVAEGEGEGVVDADEGRGAMEEFGGEPFGEAASGPVFARAWGWRDFEWGRRGSCGEEPQSGETASRGLSAGVVDAEVACELGHGVGGTGFGCPRGLEPQMWWMDADGLGRAEFGCRPIWGLDDLEAGKSGLREIRVTLGLLSKGHP